jgi:ribosomal protein S18 acetylase RimI-like enzyme
VRGQKLFVRPLEPTDRDEVGAFLLLHSPASPVPSDGLLGKLVGNLAAVLSMEIAGADVRICDLVVAPELRRKRVGRVMVDELDALAAKMERSWLVVDPGDDAREFFRRVGFAEDGSRMRRRVRAR